MGYSHRLYLVEKKVLRQIHKMTPLEFETWAKEKGIAEDEFDDEPLYVPLYCIGKEFYEFGKYYEDAIKLQHTGKPLFKNKELAKRYDHYKPFVVGQEALLLSIDGCRELIVNYYEKMLNWSDVDREEDYKERTKEQVIEEHVKSLLSEWKTGYAYNTNNKVATLTTSWKYEHAIFELVRLYKTTNWKKYGLIFMGW